MSTANHRRADDPDLSIAKLMGQKIRMAVPCHHSNEIVEMQIQINTGRDVSDNIALSEHVKAVVNKALHHLEAHLTRVEVHLDDENGSKFGVDDKSCTMEARPRHHQPIVVSHKADNMHQAVDGAARKLKSSLEHMFGRLEDQHQRPEFEEDSPP